MPHEPTLRTPQVSFHWIIAGQLAQAKRDPELLALVDELLKGANIDVAAQAATS
jgi:hypothetical protein